MSCRAETLNLGFGVAGRRVRRDDRFVVRRMLSPGLFTGTPPLLTGARLPPERLLILSARLERLLGAPLPLRKFPIGPIAAAI